MTWLASALVALLAAAAGLTAAGALAVLAVDWYSISGREGASGYFVVSVALLGGLLGFFIGLAVSRAVAAGAHPGFLKAVGASLALIGAVAGTAAAVARSLADIPPEIDGEPLFLLVEIRWPKGQADSPATLAAEGTVTLGSINGARVQRASRRGPLWLADARQLDGRWVVPGAVGVFTRRGTRSIAVAVGDSNLAGFIVPLPARPGKTLLTWSGWLPAPKGGSPPWPDDRFSYRFRVARRSESIRSEQAGPFTVETIATQFYDEVGDDGKAAIAAVAEFRLAHRGRPLVIEGKSQAAGEPAGPFDRFDGVTVLPGPAALIVHAESPAEAGFTYFVSGEGDSLRTAYLASEGTPISGELLTSDPAAFRDARRVRPRRGVVGRGQFGPGLYLIGRSVLDTRNGTVRRFTAESGALRIPAVPPLGLSPDERSFVAFGTTGYPADQPVVIVTNVAADTVATLPVDRARMRYASFDVLDPAWLLHHFEWRRGADGTDRLLERPDFVPLPYRGEFSGDRLRYRLAPAGEPVRAALEAFLVSEFGGERLPAEPDAYLHPVRIGNQVVDVERSGDFDYVALSLAHGSTDSSLVGTIGARFDRRLATGVHDGLFRREP